MTCDHWTCSNHGACRCHPIRGRKRPSGKPSGRTRGRFHAVDEQRVQKEGGRLAARGGVHCTGRVVQPCQKVQQHRLAIASRTVPRQLAAIFPIGHDNVNTELTCCLEICHPATALQNDTFHRIFSFCGPSCRDFPHSERELLVCPVVRLRFFDNPLLCRCNYKIGFFDCCFRLWRRHLFKLVHSGWG